MAVVLVRKSVGNAQYIDDDRDSEMADFQEVQEAAEFLRRDSNVNRIDTSFSALQKKAPELMKEQNPNLIRLDVFRDVVGMQRRRFYGCLSLPFSFAFFCIFALSIFLHEDITNVYVVDSGLQGYLAEDSEKVESVADVWDWLDRILITRIFGSRDNPEYNLEDKNKWRPVLTYNFLTGPLILEQKRGQQVACESDLVKHMTCFPADSHNTTQFGSTGRPVTPPGANEYVGDTVTLEERERYWRSSFRTKGANKLADGRRLRATRPEQRPFLPTGSTVDDDAFEVRIYPNTPNHLVRDHMDYLMASHWLDAQTLELKVKALLLNAEIGRPRLEQLLLTFSFNRAGGINVMVEIECLFLKFWDGLRSVLVDFVWLMCLCFLTLTTGRRLVKDLKTGEMWRKGISGWSVLQCFIVLFGWICIAFLLIQRTMVNSVRRPYAEVVEVQENDMPAEKSQLGDDLDLRAKEMVLLNSWFRTLVAFYIMLLMIRVFTSFHAQPQLGVVTSTLEASLIDIVHFLIVVLPTFMAYAISGCFIFGRRIEDFSSFESSIGVCFKIFMESEYDWPDLAEEHWLTAGMWTWSFMVVLVMIMLNMALAIVLDTYQEIRLRSRNSEPVWTTLIHMAQQLYLHRSWITNKELLHGAQDLPEQCSRDDLTRAFPRMTETQKNQLFKLCQYHTANANTATEKDARKLALAMKLVMDKINTTATELHEGHCAESDEHTGWLPHLSAELASQNHLMLSLQWHLQLLDWQWMSLEMLYGRGTSFAGHHRMPEAKTANAL